MSDWFRFGALALAIVGGACTVAAPLRVAPPRAADIDSIVSRAMSLFSVPGVAVGVIKDGKLVFGKGYGVREVGKPDKVDADTLFAIGSNTKAFTAAALAILVDEGKIGWDDKVIDHLPEFRMYDPYVTREFTIRDLLTHRSGLGLGAGDLMFLPPTDFTRSDIIRGLRFLKPVSSFRSAYAYDNLLYMIAGQIILAVTGSTWEEFVTKHILNQLHMEPCSVGLQSLKGQQNVAAYHSMVGGKLTVVASDDLQVVGASGSIQCNLRGMATWIETQLAGGKSPAGAQLFSVARGQEMWSPQTLVPHYSAEISGLTRTHFDAYGLGWALQDYNGYMRVQHYGGVPGMVTHVSMIPELNLGVVVLSNQGGGSAVSAVTLNILDAYVGAAKHDWVGLFKSMKDRAQRETKAVEASAEDMMASAALPLTSYVGLYRDPWRGDADVRLQDGELVLKISHTDRLQGVLRPHNANVFIVRWNDRSLDADAYVRFAQGFDGRIDGMTLRAVSPTTDFSFDFDDLDFRKVGESTTR